MFTPMSKLLAAAALLAALSGTVRAEGIDTPQNIVWPRAEKAQRPPTGPRSDAVIEARIHDLISRMSLEQKVGQMIQAEIKSASPSDVRAFHLGSVLNGGGSTPNGDLHAPVGAWTALADRYYEASMNTDAGGFGIPVLWGVDAVHGHNNLFGAVLFPHNIGLGAANDAELAQEIGAAVALDVRASGLNWAFAPTLAVVQNPRWGRTYEGFSQDPAIVRKLGEAFVTGLQGAPGSEGWLGRMHVIGTAKHYIGDGATADGIDQGDATVSEADLRDIHAQGYYGALKADVQTVMVSFSSWNGEKMHVQRHLITEVLKGRMGFDGFVVSDWNAIGQAPGCSVSDCPAAINAGIDMIMAPTDWRALYSNILNEARSGAIPLSRIDDAVSRILRVKLRAGLFEAGRPSEAIDQHSSAPASEERALARRAVQESLVLLKNRGHVLPLERKLNLLVTGDGADSIPRQSGGWSLTWQGTETSNSDFPGATSIFQGVKQVVESAGGSAVLSPDASFTTKPDAALVVFGESPYAEGQGDVRDLGWSNHNAKGLEAIKKLRAAGVPVVSVFRSGRPRWTNPEINASDAFIAAFRPGTEGEGVADLLFKPAPGARAMDFKGRLSFAWPSTALSPKGPEGVQFPVGFGLALAGSDDMPNELPEAPGVVVGQDRALTTFFFRGAVSPWRVFLGDPAGWQTPLTTAKSVSASKILTVEKVDHRVQEDALHASWSGTGLAQIYLQSAGGFDWSVLLKQRRTLTFSMRLHQRPSAPTFVRQDCIYPCGAKADVTRLMNSVPMNQWVRVSIDQACFVKNGLDPRKVETPFLLATTGKLDLDLSYIDLEPAGQTPPTIQCE